MAKVAIIGAGSLVFTRNLCSDILLTPALQASTLALLPCLVDQNGVQGVVVGALPKQLAALNRTNINVQELAVDGALRGDRDAVHHAVMLDPLTAAVCTLSQIHALVEVMFAAQGRWPPQFSK